MGVSKKKKKKHDMRSKNCVNDVIKQRLCVALGI